MLEECDFDFSPGAPKALLHELAGLAFVERTKNIVLIGPSGVANAHLAIALGYRATQSGIMIRLSIMVLSLVVD